MKCLGRSSNQFKMSKKCFVWFPSHKLPYSDRLRFIRLLSWWEQRLALRIRVRLAYRNLLITQGDATNQRAGCLRCPIAAVHSMCRDWDKGVIYFLSCALWFQSPHPSPPILICPGFPFSLPPSPCIRKPICRSYQFGPQGHRHLKRGCLSN